MKNNRFVYLIIGLAGVALVTWSGYTLWHGHKAAQSKTSPSTSIQVQALKGTIVCLPFKGTGPKPAMCASGLQTTDGKYYAIKNATEQVQSEVRTLTTGTQVTVTGTYSDAAADDEYAISGIVVATDISKTK